MKRAQTTLTADLVLKPSNALKTTATVKRTSQETKCAEPAILTNTVRAHVGVERVPLIGPAQSAIKKNDFFTFDFLIKNIRTLFGLWTMDTAAGFIGSVLHRASAADLQLYTGIMGTAGVVTFQDLAEKSKDWWEQRTRPVHPNGFKIFHARKLREVLKKSNSKMQL